MDWLNTLRSLDWQSAWVQVQTVPAYAWVIVALVFLLWRERRNTRRAYATLERSNRELVKALTGATGKLADVALRSVSAVEQVYDNSGDE